MNTPQPHADDVKLEEQQWFERITERLMDDKFGEMNDKDIPSAVAVIFNDDPTPQLKELRLSNEALRERVKELETFLHNREASLKREGEAWAKAMTERDEARTKLHAADERVKELEEINKRSCQDWAEDDTFLDNLLAKHEIKMWGDSYGMPCIQDKVEALSDKLTAVSEVIKKCEKALNARDKIDNAPDGSSVMDYRAAHDTKKQALAAIKQLEDKEGK